MEIKQEILSSLKFSDASSNEKYINCVKTKESLQKIGALVAKAALSNSKKSLQGALMIASTLNGNLVKRKIISNEIRSLIESSSDIAQSEFVLLSLNTEQEKVEKEIEKHKASFEIEINPFARFESKKSNLRPINNGISLSKNIPIVITFIAKSGRVFTQNLLNIDMLNRTGFKASTIGEYSYPVIENQLVVGIDVSKLENETVSEKLLRLIVFINKKFGKHYMEVSEIPHIQKGVTYFWLMRQDDLRRFAKAFPGGHIKFHKWGFAFNGE